MIFVITSTKEWHLTLSFNVHGDTWRELTYHLPKTKFESKPKFIVNVIMIVEQWCPWNVSTTISFAFTFTITSYLILTVKFKHCNTNDILKFTSEGYFTLHYWIMLLPSRIGLFSLCILFRACACVEYDMIREIPSLSHWFHVNVILCWVWQRF